jgi:hypothetical protein
LPLSGTNHEEKGLRIPILFANSRAGAIPDPEFLELAKRTSRELARLRHAWQRFSVLGLSRMQRDTLDALENIGFFILLEYQAKEGKD